MKCWQQPIMSGQYTNFEDMVFSDCIHDSNILLHNSVLPGTKRLITFSVVMKIHPNMKMDIYDLIFNGNLTLRLFRICLDR